MTPRTDRSHPARGAPRGRGAGQRHPLFRRLSWHPLVAAFPLAWIIYNAATSGLTVMRVAGLLVVGVWFVLSVIDLVTRHRVLDWIYGEELE